MYARYMRCVAELGTEPPADGTDVQAVAAGAPEPAPVCGLLWRSYPHWSFLATHRCIVQDKAAPPAPEWYGQGKPDLFLEDAEGRVLIDDPDGLMAGLPGGVVLRSVGAPSQTVPGGLRILAPPTFPGGAGWLFDEGGAASATGHAVARFHQATPGRPWPPPTDDGWFVIGDVLAGARIEALTAPKPAGCVVVPGGRDPCGTAGFPRAPLPGFLTDMGGFRSVSSPHYDPETRIMVQDGSACDDLQRAIPPAERTSRAALFARCCLLWRNLAPTAADTLPCPTRSPGDVVCPPWPKDAPPIAIVLGAGACRVGSVVVARNPALGAVVTVVALGLDDGFTAGALSGGGGPLAWSWI